MVAPDAPPPEDGLPAQPIDALLGAIVGVARTHGTVLGPVPADRLADVWTLAVCHRLAQSLKQAFTSRDPSGATWRRFVTAWERAHLELAGYFRTHPRAFGPDAQDP
jgi:hypothetical protein